MKIWIDADACPRPVKEHVFKTSARFNLPVSLVANSHMQIPESPIIDFIKVDQGDDVADFYIAENCSTDDIIITQDIPLADIIVKKGAIAMNPRGEIYTEENIGERLSMRDFMTELRSEGTVTSGPPPFDQKAKIEFVNALDRLLTKLKGKK